MIRSTPTIRCSLDFINIFLLFFALFKFFKSDERVHRFVGNVEKHLISNPINVSRTWATEAEIFAAALLFDVNINVYSGIKDQWQFFGRKGRLSDAVPSEKCLYIKHHNGNHYQVVKDVE